MPKKGDPRPTGRSRRPSPAQTAAPVSDDFREAPGTLGKNWTEEEHGTEIVPIKAPVWHPNRTLLAIDPGDVHVGVAEFQESDSEWECLRAYEVTWTEGADLVAKLLADGPAPDLLVVENFRLRQDLALQQSGSEMETSQLIGVIKYLHTVYERRRHNLTHDENGRIRFKGFENRDITKKCELVMQEPHIQKATNAILLAKGVESEAHGNDHARSAELHGWHRILRENV